MPRICLDALGILAAVLETYRAAWKLLADTGMRAAELAHLTWQDVDLARNVLHIRPEDDWRPKTGDQRAIPMTPRVKTLLERQPRRGRGVVTASPSPRYPHGDHQRSERRLLRGLKRVLGGLDLQGHLHTFRHAFISKCLMSGIPEAVVREWVGHVDRDILRLCTHIASAQSQAAMRRVVGESEGSSIGKEDEPRRKNAPERGPVRFQNKSQEEKVESSAK